MQTPFDNVNSPGVHARQLGIQPDPQYLAHQREMRAETDAERKAKSYRPDGKALRALRAVAYVVLIITCIAVLFVAFDIYSWIHDVRQAMRSWLDTVTSAGILGD